MALTSNKRFKLLDPMRDGKGVEKGGAQHKIIIIITTPS